MTDYHADFNIAAGGSCILNPAGVYLKEPVFDKEEIIYAELDADDRRHTKAYFDALGHYTRWDVLRLDIRGEPAEPLIERRPRREFDQRTLRLLAEKYGIESENIKGLLEELESLR